MPEFYRSHSPTTDPGDYAYLLDNLPTDLADIAAVTQGLVYHYVADQQVFGWAPPKARLPEINTRAMPAILATLLATLLAKDNRPLTVARAYADRLVGCCRDFVLAWGQMRLKCVGVGLSANGCNWMSPHSIKSNSSAGIPGRR